MYICHYSSIIWTTETRRKAKRQKAIHNIPKQHPIIGLNRNLQPGEQDSCIPITCSHLPKMHTSSRACGTPWRMEGEAKAQAFAFSSTTAKRQGLGDRPMRKRVEEESTSRPLPQLQLPKNGWWRRNGERWRWKRGKRDAVSVRVSVLECLPIYRDINNDRIMDR